MSDLFSSLSVYASRQEENFLTESLVYLLNTILEREVQLGLDLLSNLCANETTAWFETDSDISIST